MFRKLTKTQVAGGLFVVVLISFWIWRGVQKGDIRNNGVIVQARIIELLPPGKGMTDAIYRCEFEYLGETKSLTSGSSVDAEKRSYIGQSYPALYSIKYDKVQLLLNSKDSSDYNVK